VIDHDLAVALAGLGEDLHPRLDPQVRGEAADEAPIPRHQELALLEQHHGRGVGLARHRGEGALLVGDGGERRGVLRRRGGARGEQRQSQTERVPPFHERLLFARMLIRK
jgi:hypothetical protein